MQADEEVGRMAKKQTPYRVRKALEMFMVDMVSKECKRVSADAKRGGGIREQVGISYTTL